MEKSTQIKPVIVKKGNIAFIKKVSNEKSGTVRIGTLYRDDVLYDTKDVYFLKGEYQRLLLVNRLNLGTKAIVTLAKYFRANGTVFEKTSDRITTLIGQEEYKTVFSGLCSILDENLKIRSILALLSKSEDLNKELNAHNTEDKCSQTDEIRIKFTPARKRRRIRMKPGPYIVNDLKNPEPQVKRIIVHIPQQNISEDLESSIKCVKIENLSPNSKNLETEEGTDAHRGNENKETDQDSELSVEDYISNEKSLESHEKGIETLRKGPEIHGKGIETFSKGPEIHGKGSESDGTSHPTLPVIDFHEELSNDSEGAYSSFSIETALVENSMSILVERFTKDIGQEYFVQPNHTITVMDGTKPVTISLPYKPEDILHIATPENLQLMDAYSKKLLIKHQMNLDFRHCLTVVDDDGNLPIHLAVLNDDVELIRRQCFVLKVLKNRSVDIPAHGLKQEDEQDDLLILTDNAAHKPVLGSARNSSTDRYCAEAQNKTPLTMSIYQDTTTSTSILLQFGADLMQTDDEHRTPLHLAAERNTDHLAVLVKYCCDNSRKILLESDLWKPEMESQSDQELSKFLLKYLFTAADKQGYTPLMVSSKLGHSNNVRLILEQATDIINSQMPTSGNTALYLACEAACNTSAERGDITKVEDHFQKTIELLIKHGADPSIDNYSGSNVNALLAEFNCSSLSSLIATEVTKCNIKKNSITISTAENCDKVMLVKSETGTIDLKTLVNEKQKSRKKPVKILQNIQIKKPAMKSTKVNESTKINESIKIKESIKMNELIKINNPISKSAGKIIEKKIILSPESVKCLKRKMVAPVIKQIKIVKK